MPYTDKPYNSETIPFSLSGLHSGTSNYDDYKGYYGDNYQYRLNKQRSAYSRNNSWLESIIPTIDTRENAIPRIQQSKSSITQKIGERKQSIENLNPQIEIAQKKAEEARNIKITIDEFRPQGYSGNVRGRLYNNEYDYAVRSKDLAISTANAEVSYLSNQKTNYEKDIEEASKIITILDNFEKQKKYEFLNDYESRSAPVFFEGGPIIPAMTPTGMLNYKKPRHSKSKALSFKPYQTPFEPIPLWKSPRKLQRGGNVTDEFTRQARQSFSYGNNTKQNTGAINRMMNFGKSHRGKKW